jgi:predicted ABC-class ATPase
MLPWERLRDKLLTLEGKPYQAYKSLEGAYRFERFVLYLDVMAQEPGLSSPMRVRVDQAVAQFPPDLWSTRTRKMAVEDFIARRWHETIRKVMRAPHAGRGGFSIEAGGQQMLERTACRITEEWVEVRGTITMPSDARKAAPKNAQAMITEDIAQLIDGALIHSAQNPAAVQRHVELAEDAEALRELLAERGLVAFIADGAVLPREPGSDKPLLSHLVTWQSPAELRMSITLPHRGAVSGLGIPRGITVIIGPPLSGRSTLLSGLAAGVYAHVAGDGRELSATAADATLVTGDEGRRIEGVNLQPFITQLRTGEDVTQYRTDQAPALLSQAAGLVETLEAGCSVLLIDEDSSAPGFLIQDELLRRLFPHAAGQVVPLVDLLRPLYEEHGISSVIVSSAGSAYARIADTVIAMEELHPVVATDQAKQLVGGGGPSEPRRAFGGIHHRVPLPESVGHFRGRRLRAELSGPRDVVSLGRDAIHLSRLQQLAEPGQARATGAAVLYAAEQGYIDGSRTVREVLALVDGDITQRGLDVLEPGAPVGDLARPRRQEIAAALNRLRSLRVKS